MHFDCPAGETFPALHELRTHVPPTVVAGCHAAHPASVARAQDAGAALRGPIRDRRLGYLRRRGPFARRSTSRPSRGSSSSRGRRRSTLRSSPPILPPKTRTASGSACFRRKSKRREERAPTTTRI